MDELLKETDKQKISEIRDILNEDISALNERRDMELYAMEMYLGDQWKRVRKKRAKSYLSINMIKGRVDTISGWIRQNRTDLAMSPIGAEDDRKADVYSQLLKYVFANKKFWNAWCDSIDDMLITGLGWAHPYIAYEFDVYAGEILCEQENGQNIIYDPYLTNFDLSDCSHIARHKYIDKKIAAMRWPKFKKEFELLGDIAEKSFFASSNRDFESKSRLNFVEFWERTSEERTHIYDSASDRMEEFDGDERDAIQRMTALGMDTSTISFMKRTKSVIKVTLSCEDELIMHEGLSDIDDEYPFIPIVGWYTPAYPHWKDKLQGVAWILHDIQIEKNKRRNQLNEFIFTKNLKGYLKLRSANVDIRSFESGESEFIDTDDMTGIRELEPPRIPEVYPFLEKQSDSDFAMVGPRDLMEASAGAGAQSPVGSLQIFQRESLVKVKKILDNIDTSYEMLGNYVVKLMNKSWPSEIMRKIVGDNIIGAKERKELIVQMKNIQSAPPSPEKDQQIAAMGQQIQKLEADTEEFWNNFDETRKDIRYDCRISTTTPNATQRLATLQILSDLMKQGKNVPTEIWIPYTELPPAEKERWLEIEKQAQEMQMQMQMQMAQAKLKLEDKKINAGVAKQDSINASQERIAQTNTKESSNE